MVRRSKQTSFIYPNGESYRIIDRESNHFNFIQKYKKIYSTSANENKKSFSLNFALEKAEIVVYTKELFQEKQGSKIMKLNKVKKKKIR